MSRHPVTSRAVHVATRVLAAVVLVAASFSTSPPRIQAASLASATTWTLQPTTVTNPILGMSAVSPSVAWAVTYGGSILRTIDGGANWVELPTACAWYALPSCVGYEYLFDITASSADEAWAVGIFGTVIHTTDGGVTWTVQRTGNQVDETKHISRAPDGTLWAGGWGAVLRSVDGGTSWSASAVRPDGGPVNDVVAVSANEAWLTGYGAQAHVWHTTDGGATWTAPLTFPANPTPNPKSVDSLSISPGGRIWTLGVLCEEGASPFCSDVLNISDDGGQSWSQSTVGDYSLTTIAAVSNTTAWMTGIGGIVLFSEDGGSSWSVQSNGSANVFYDMVAGSPTTLWVGGGGGVILRGDVPVPGAAPVLTVPSNASATATGPTGAVVTYSVTAVDSAGVSLTPVCVPVSGSTFPVGTTTVTCTATDTLGYTTSAAFPVTVGYGFAGFFQPLDDPVSAPNPMSVFKGGSTIPVKFVLTYSSGSPISDAVASAIAASCGATISLTQTPGNAPSVGEVDSSATANTGTCFRYDAVAHQFIFNLGSKGYLAPSLYLVGAKVVGPDATVLAIHSLAIGLR